MPPDSACKSMIDPSRFKKCFRSVSPLKILGRGITRILHESEAFICKAFKGAAIVRYCKPLITQQMEAPGSPDPLERLVRRSFSEDVSSQSEA